MLFSTSNYGWDKFVSVYKSIIRDENKSEIGYLWVTKDITEHIFSENELRNINLELGPISH